MQTMNIGRLAELAQVSIDTIRYYEKQKLMPPAARTASGYRQYTHADLERLRFILRSKDLGFTLAEIGELLSLTQDRESDMAASRARPGRAQGLPHRCRIEP